MCSISKRLRILFKIKKKKQGLPFDTQRHHYNPSRKQAIYKRIISGVYVFIQQSLFATTNAYLRPSEVYCRRY